MALGNVSKPEISLHRHSSERAASTNAHETHEPRHERTNARCAAVSKRPTNDNICQHSSTWRTRCKRTFVRLAAVRSASQQTLSQPSRGQPESHETTAAVGDKLQALQALPMPPAGGGLCGEQPPCIPPRTKEMQGIPPRANALGRDGAAALLSTPFVSGSNIRGLTDCPSPRRSGDSPSTPGSRRASAPLPCSGGDARDFRRFLHPSSRSAVSGSPGRATYRGVGGNVVLAVRNAPGWLSARGGCTCEHQLGSCYGSS